MQIKYFLQENMDGIMVEEKDEMMDDEVNEMNELLMRYRDEWMR